MLIVLGGLVKQHGVSALLYDYLITDLPALAARALGPAARARVPALARRVVQEARALAQAVPGRAQVAEALPAG